MVERVSCSVVEAYTFAVDPVVISFDERVTAGLIVFLEPYYGLYRRETNFGYSSHLLSSIAELAYLYRK